MDQDHATRVELMGWYRCHLDPVGKTTQRPTSGASFWTGD